MTDCFEENIGIVDIFAKNEPEVTHMEDIFEDKPMEDIFIENEPKSTGGLIDTFEKLNEKSREGHRINFTDSELGIYPNNENEIQLDTRYKIVRVIYDLCIKEIYDNPQPYVEEIDCNRVRFTFYESLSDKVIPCVYRLKDNIDGITVNGELLEDSIRCSLFTDLNNFLSFYQDIENFRQYGFYYLVRKVVYTYVRGNMSNSVYVRLYEYVAELILSKF